VLSRKARLSEACNSPVWDNDPFVKSKPTHADIAGSRYLALQRLARAQKRTTAELLQLYVLESFLRRLVRSRHDHTLVLKGGMLLAAFDLRRATRRHA
jgi:hypothetical protein